jgi:hypothetical protein
MSTKKSNMDNLRKIESYQKLIEKLGQHILNLNKLVTENNGEYELVPAFKKNSLEATQKFAKAESLLKKITELHKQIQSMDDSNPREIHQNVQLSKAVKLAFNSDNGFNQGGKFVGKGLLEILNSDKGVLAKDQAASISYAFQARAKEIMEDSKVSCFSKVTELSEAHLECSTEKGPISCEEEGKQSEQALNSCVYLYTRLVPDHLELVKVQQSHVPAVIVEYQGSCDVSFEGKCVIDEMKVAISQPSGLAIPQQIHVPAIIVKYQGSCDMPPETCGIYDMSQVATVSSQPQASEDQGICPVPEACVVDSMQITAQQQSHVPAVIVEYQGSCDVSFEEKCVIDEMKVAISQPSGLAIPAIPQQSHVPAIIVKYQGSCDMPLETCDIHDMSRVATVSPQPQASEDQGSCDVPEACVVESMQVANVVTYQGSCDIPQENVLWYAIYVEALNEAGVTPEDVNA